MRTLRRVLFYLFLALYLAATPMVILYALGYLYRPGAEHGLVRTGLVSLKTVPGDARVFVGSSRYRWRTPTIIRGLLPGDYALRLTLRDHQPWSGFVTIEPEKATVLEDILLLPRDLTPRVIAEGPFDELVAEPGPDWFLVRRGDRAGGLAVYDLDREDLRPVVPSNHPMRDARVELRAAVNGSPYLLLGLEGADGPRCLWCPLDDARDEPADITRLFPEPPGRVTWDRKARDELFALRQDAIARLRIDEGAIYPGVLGRVSSFAVYRDRLYAIDESNHFVRASRDGEDIESAGKSPPEIQTFWRAPGGYAIHVLDSDAALFLDDRGRLLASVPPYEIADEGIEGLRADSREPAALVWDRHRIGRIAVRRAEHGEDGPTIDAQWIHHADPPIRHAQEIHDGTHVLFAADGRLLLLALPEGGGGEPREVARLHRDARFFFSERTGSVYGLDEQRRLIAIRLLPRRELLPRPLARPAEREGAR